jgi:putative addiction module component (TIGR02574 family)
LEECGVADHRIEPSGSHRTRGSPRLCHHEGLRARSESVTKEDIEAAALQLPERDRARLAELLLASLDEEDEVAAAWADEAERRFEELKSGKTKAMPADEVLERIRSRLR